MILDTYTLSKDPQNKKKNRLSRLSFVLASLSIILNNKNYIKTHEEVI